MSVSSSRILFAFRTILFALFIFVTESNSFSQQIILNAKTYKGGYNVSCNSANDGEIDATVVGGVSPYSFLWSNGATTQNITGIGTGSYTLIVTDSLGNMDTSKTITLIVPELLDAYLYPSKYATGYNISKTGANDGFIKTEIKGGTPPYNYLWNTTSTKADIFDLVATTYSVTITDQNGCSINKSQILTQPTTLQIVSIVAADHNGHNVSCFKGNDGSIDLTVVGGATPYSYTWGNGSFDEDPSGLMAGNYKVQVKDANGATVYSDISLTQPDELKLTLTTSNYNGYSISCYDCANGSINTIVTGGTAAYTYFWESSQTSINGQTMDNLTNLMYGAYSVRVTDANGCFVSEKTGLSQPFNGDWQLLGNVIDSSNFLGTINSFPLIIKTNNTEKMRITEDGNVGIGTALAHNSNGYKLAVNGKIGGKEILIEINSDAWSDFVFEPTYQRMSFLEKEKFYTKEKHLPNIKSAKDIGTNGLDVSKVMSGITQNVEENTLDIVDLYKKILSLEKENMELKLKMENLESKK